MILAIWFDWIGILKEHCYFIFGSDAVINFISQKCNEKQVSSQPCFCNAAFFIVSGSMLLILRSKWFGLVLVFFLQIFFK